MILWPAGDGCADDSAACGQTASGREANADGQTLSGLGQRCDELIANYD
ncbi:MAG: hypothetical protein HFH34_04185 [Eubacterium sp.]|nr:hypothetical protein [Eubacterium sp.]